MMVVAMVSVGKLRRLWSLPLGAGLLLAVVWLQGQRLQTIQSTEPQPLAILQLQDQRDQAQLLLRHRMPTFGYNNMVANWTFLNFLQYFGNADVRQQIGYRLSPDFFQIIVDNDPYFVLPYLFLSTSTSLFAGDPDRAVDLMAQGVSTMTPNTPEGGYLVWRYMGIDKLLFLGDGEGAQKAFETAADWAEQSSLPDAEAVAQASRQTAQFLAENPTSKAAQINAWIQMASYAVDDETRRLAIERIESLGGEILADERGGITVRYRTDE